MNIHDKYELAKKLIDPKFYLESFTQVKTKSGRYEKFIFNKAQIHFTNHFNKSNLLIINKARQLWFSTLGAWLDYHDAITNEGHIAALIGYNTELTQQLLDKVKDFYNTTPVELRPRISYNSKFELSFPDMGSKVMIFPSTSNVGRWYTINVAHASEYSFWDKASEKMRSLQNAVPPGHGKIVIESTPNGVGNEYFRIFTQKNNWTKLAYGWWWGYSKEEIEVIRSNMDERSFAQEYGMAFLSSGRTVFDQKIIMSQQQYLVWVWEKYNDNEDVEHTVYEEDNWTVFQNPKSDHFYVIWCDVAEGSWGDYSVADIYDRHTWEQVAQFRSNTVKPDKFGEVLNTWGRKYNNALLAIESNNHGLVTVYKVRDLFYPNIYFRPKKYGVMGSSMSENLGWKTTQTTRPILIDDLQEALRDKSLILHSRDTFNELLTFVYNDNNEMVTAEGSHDDTIFAMGIANQAFKIMYNGPLTQIDYNNYLPSSGY